MQRCFSVILWGCRCALHWAGNAAVQARQRELLPASPAALSACATIPSVLEKNTYEQEYFKFWGFCQWSILKNGRIPNLCISYWKKTFFCKAIWVKNKQTKKPQTSVQRTRSIYFPVTFWAGLPTLQAQPSACSLGRQGGLFPAHWDKGSGASSELTTLLSHESEQLPLPPPEPQWLCRSSRSKY